MALLRKNQIRGRVVNNASLIGLYIGIGGAILFMIYSIFWLKKVPTLNQVAVVLLACTGAIVGLNLGYLGLTVDDSQLGILKDQRVAVVLGALAVIWTSAESIFNTVREHTLRAASYPPSPQGTAD